MQFLRSKASEWNLASRRFAATGVSAGAVSSLWLAFHDDLANASSEDPFAQQSTRLIAVAGKAPPTSLDPQQMREAVFGLKLQARIRAVGGKCECTITARRHSSLQSFLIEALKQ